LTGIPVFSYSTAQNLDDAKVNEGYALLKAADAAKYIMGFGTGGVSDRYLNSCGVANAHAYSIMTVFELTEADNTVTEMLLVRNPWGQSFYSGDWNKDDVKWTNDLLK
jgi:hypothetical protein